MKASRSSAPLRVLWWLSFAVFMLGLIWLGVYLVQMSGQNRSLGELSAFVHGYDDLPRAASGSGDASAPDAPAVNPQQTDAAAQSIALEKSEPPAPAVNPQQTDVAAQSITPEKSEPPAPAINPPQTDAAAQNIAPDKSEPPAQVNPIAIRYRELAAINPDFIGWITIAGTRVDYPVMHSPAVPERYLSRDFDRNHSFSGLPFLDALCDVDGASGNSIIFGHNMRNGSMFADLHKYRDQKFLDENPIIEYNTLYGGGKYSIMAIFNINTTSRDAPSMVCYRLFDTNDMDEIAELNAYIEKYALLRGQDACARLGDRLLTLSTCSKANSAQRLIVMARCVEYEKYE